ncbi:XdhC family protein [Paraurantiacibacter namhicola]|uniref:XdhC and CoxI family protein n=1 Tax=Paraurantiacibacter namhicola TaxID=645517 RepID=A0A1C7DAA6_9SPHN|nr:XdhC family protein [Paraurantiacibacter namhicola]ANU08426.1 XdhC and CoxI family protein [Paraurantiacibacter namhicola]
MFDAPRILSFLQETLRQGQPACLVTVTDVTGASVRNPGAHMAVAADGSFAGSLSGGCIERAVVSEALAAMEAGAPHCIAYGAGSPIIDIRLPCGGRVDLLFTPIADTAAVDALLIRLAAREVAVLSLPTGEGVPLVLDAGETGWQDKTFLVRHHPPLRLVIAGHGGTVEALVRQSEALGIACHVATPDADLAEALSATHADVRRLMRLDEALGFALDGWTAAAFFFHDHDWETALLAEVLGSSAFYVGAMGSRATHAGRMGLLQDAGVPEGAIARIVAPIGLIPSSRDPETLALSVLAQVVDSYNEIIGAQFPNAAAVAGEVSPA